MRLASLTSALVLFGCANQGDEGMIVLANNAIAGDSCSNSGDTGQAFRPHGFIHATSKAGYVLTPLVQSRIEGTEQDPTGRTIIFRGADVRLTVKSTEIEQGGVYMTNNTERAIDPFSVLFSGSLAANATAGLIFEVMSGAQVRDIVSASGVNLAAGQNVNVEVLAEVTINGTLGGDEVSAAPFHYPISVCSDCIIDYRGACPLMGTSEANPCNPLQDGVLACCTDMATNAVVCTP